MIVAASMVVLAYLLGSASGSLLVGRLRGGVDIRTLGSGNAGGTNAMRTQGASFAIPVLLIDVGKGWLATAALPALMPDAPQWLPVACGLGAIVGHVFPVWHGFRGGKGVATLVGAVAGLAPVLLLPMLGTWLLVAIAFGYVGLASMAAAASLPFSALLLDVAPRGALIAFGLLVAGFIVYTHRGNLARMRRGREPRARRLWWRGLRTQ